MQLNLIPNRYRPYVPHDLILGKRRDALFIASQRAYMTYGGVIYDEFVKIGRNDCLN